MFIWRRFQNENIFVAMCKRISNVYDEETLKVSYKAAFGIDWRYKFNFNLTMWKKSPKFVHGKIKIKVIKKWLKPVPCIFTEQSQLQNQKRFEATITLLFFFLSGKYDKWFFFVEHHLPRQCSQIAAYVDRTFIRSKYNKTQLHFRWLQIIERDFGTLISSES